MTFQEATKHYFSLGYDDRMAWQKEYIDYANTVKDLQFVMNHISKDYRKEIVERMREIAVTDEEKKIAYFYKI